MKTKLFILTLVLTGSTLGLRAQEPNPAPGDERRGPMLLPPPVAEQLNVTDKQREQVAKLEAEIKAKMEKILTPEQLQQMKELRPPMQQRGPGGPNARQGGAGGPPMGGPGGPNARMRGPGGPDAPMGAPGMQGGMGGQRPVMPIILALDLNKDGTIDAVEIDKAAESLKTMDKNGDGKLTPEEVRPPQQGGMGGFQGPAGQGRRGGPGGQRGPGGQGLPQPPPPQQ